MINHIDFENAHRLMSEKTDSVILDVREEEEYITGHAVGAALFPVDTIDEKTAAELIPSKNTPLFIYCRSGRRSKIAAEKLSRLGYTQIYDIGSLSGWPYGLE